MIAEIRSQIITDPQVTIPSSKSISHRALIAAALAEGTSRIMMPVENDDTAATISCLKHLGAGFLKEGSDLLVTGCGGRIHYDGQIVDCGESGSTLRFLIPVFALLKEKAVFTGHGRLMQRPQGVYEDIFHQRNLMFEQNGETLVIRGPLTGGEFEVDGNVSSQFISGLMFALPLCKEDSRIRIIPPMASASYVNLTVDALAKAGVKVTGGPLVWDISGNGTYHPFESRIEGDASQAAFFAVLSAITQTPFTVHNLNHDSHQGDMAILKIMKTFGTGNEKTEDGYIFRPDCLKGCEVDLEDCPDLGPVLFALATQAEGTSIFRNTARLRIKESDRVQAMAEELHKLGCDMRADENSVIIHGKTKLHGGVALESHKDHRIAMALSILASVAENPVTISGAEAIAKSYPEFYEHLEKTGIGVKTYD